MCHHSSLTVMRGEYDIDRNLKSGVSGPLAIAGQPFEHGIHVYVDSKVRFRLSGGYERLTGCIGIDDWVGPHGEPFAFAWLEQQPRQPTICGSS